MSEMIERVAKAIELGFAPASIKPFLGEPEPETLSVARAAIEAMRELSDLQRWHGSVQFERMKAEGYDAGEAAMIIYQRMIDTALNTNREG